MRQCHSCGGVCGGTKKTGCQYRAPTIRLTVDEALAWADANSAPEVRERLKSRAVAYALAQEVRRLRGQQ